MKGSSKTRAIAAAVGSAVMIGAALWMSVEDRASARPVYGLATIGLTALVALFGLAYAIATLSRRSHERADPALAAQGASYRHLVRPVAALLLVATAAAVARAALVPSTYGELGYYRGDAAREAMHDTAPLHQSKSECQKCHTQIAKTHEKDVHRQVECETCHGPGADHVAWHRQNPGAKGPEGRPLFVPKTKEPCLWCHRRLVSRPSLFPQIDPAEHYAFLGVTDEQTPCAKCHSPHEPLFLDRHLTEARLHPVIQQCRNCHREPVSATAKRPSSHPVIFECQSCHPEVAKSQKSAAHGKLACAACHQVYRVSETASRVVKHRSPRFCLLCHQKSTFRGKGSPPLLNWDEHRKKQGIDDPKASCVECHEDKIHGSTSDLRRAAILGAKK